MKKIFNLALIGAIALTGPTMFAGCSASDDATAENNPNYDEKKNEVTTQFVLNIAANTNDNVTTRQSANIVQKNSNFRGMQDAKLIGLATNSSFLAPYAEGTTTTDWTAASGIKSKTYDLGTLYAANSVDNSGTNNENSSSHRVVELTLPLTTDAMLVYGRAITSGTDEENGKVDYNITTAPENITFDLVSRLGGNGTKYSHTCNLVALILNRIMLSEVDALTYDSSNPYKTPRTVTDLDAYKQTGNLPALSWRTLGADATGSLAPLQENLSKLYKSITSFTTSGEGANKAIRSGSASAILDMTKDMYSIVKSVYYATPTTDAELNAQRLAYEILTRMDYYFTTEGTTFRYIGNSTTEGSIAKALVDNNVITADGFTTNYGDVTDILLSGLPISFNLPAGVSQLYFAAYSANTGAATGGFTYSNPSQSLIDISSTLDPAKYMYPSELLYFDNSLLRVNDSEVPANEYPNGYGVWDTESNWTGTWTTGKVSSTTRSVAVKNNINYGVAMLQTSVALKSGVTDFNDNRNAIVPTEGDQTLTAAEVGAFTLTGILIGGQYKKLGWNYLAKDVSSNDNFVIYDNKIANEGDIPTAIGNENYTLVFDNYLAGGGDQQDVLVALELQNGNEKDFYGIGGIITKGSKFYLVGKLKLTEGTGTITWPDKYAIPPYTASGTSQEVTRIFIQDYVTTATFTIGANSLKSAYSTVPDLRASQTSLGLSVDLNWRPGLTFSVDL